jgi:hypothetical protein
MTLRPLTPTGISLRIKKSLISKRSIEFIRSLNGKKRMEMVLAPDGLGHETLIFTLGNLDDVLKLVGDQCYN